MALHTVVALLLGISDGTLGDVVVSSTSPFCQEVIIKYFTQVMQNKASCSH